MPPREADPWPDFQTPIWTFPRLASRSALFAATVALLVVAYGIRHVSGRSAQWSIHQFVDSRGQLRTMDADILIAHEAVDVCGWIIPSRSRVEITLTTGSPSPQDPTRAPTPHQVSAAIAQIIDELNESSDHPERVRPLPSASVLPRGVATPRALAAGQVHVATAVSAAGSPPPWRLAKLAAFAVGLVLLVALAFRTVADLMRYRSLHLAAARLQHGRCPRCDHDNGAATLCSECGTDVAVAKNQLDRAPQWRPRF